MGASGGKDSASTRPGGKETGRRRRKGLSRERIARAALELLDAVADQAPGRIP